MNDKLDQAIDKASNYSFGAAILTVFLLAFGLRYYPARNIEYLQALDPYNLFRMSQQIAYTGSLPDLDFMRYFPYASPTYVSHQLNLWIPAIMYKMGGFLAFENYLGFAKTIAPLFSALSAVTMYFLGRELYDKYTGLGAAFFIAVLPGAMFRGSAGFFEKEAIGTFFMMVSLLFFTLAWKNRNWAYGMVSGLALGIFSATWGGSQMLWLLYPMIIGFMLLINEATEDMIPAFTPIVIIAAFVGAVFNPNRLWLGSKEVLLSFGFLGLLWVRYLVEELDIVAEDRLDYFMPSTYIAGAFVLALSPLYSQTVASLVYSIYTTATQSGSGVIGGTVAENASTQMSQLISQMGSGVLSGVFPGVGAISSLFGTWTLVFIGFPMMISTLYLMFGRKYGIIEEGLSGKRQYGVIAGVIAAWAIGFTAFFEGYRAFGLIAGLVLSVVLALINFYIDEDSAFNISVITLVFTALVASLYALGQNSVQETATILRGVAYPIWLSIAGLGIVYTTESFEPMDIGMDWYKIIPVFWLGTNLLGAVARSRLVYLATFSAALGAGYMLSRVIRKLQTMEFSDTGLDSSRVRIVLLLVLALGVVTVNVAAGFFAVSSSSGSPNQLWMENLDYLDEEAPNGSVTMSWWDYGYHFQSIGRTGTVADGGNFGYYTSEEKVNYPLAQYFASNDTRENYDELYNKHSVDYVVLDNTMIGKYSAVSQIANRDNENFNSMYQVSTPNSAQQSISESEDRTVMNFQGRVAQWNAQIYAPIEINNNTVEVSDTVTMQTHTGESIEINCILTEDGIQNLGDEDSEESNFCVAIDPYYSLERGLSFEGFQSRITVIPRDVADHNLMRLYFMDGHGMDYLEKVEEGSNDYVKMWEVTE
ncbi:MAG: STT3 domain-containing protein [Candidatus Nanohaloarchaea archaeon]